MAEVVCNNFPTLLPLIQECIDNSEFLAIDTEFTGLSVTSEDDSSLFDVIEERYQKLRRFAQTFIICQFGLSAFTKDPKANRYVAHTFNFYLFPRQQGSSDCRFSIQASNADFLCENRFDFNKLFYEGIPYLNNKQEEELLDANGSALGEKERQEALGFTQVFRALVKCKKPILGHNTMNDLFLMYEKFHEPLPERYADFKQKLHQLFPVLIDTKNICHGLHSSRYIAGSNLLGFSSLIDLYNAFGSQRGTYYVLCSPDICHAEESQKYNSERSFHEAGFDAFCVGFVFIRIAHLVAMKEIQSTEARPVPMRQYLRVMKPYTNRINLIRGPINYIDLAGPDPVSTRSSWLTVTTRTGKPLSMQLLHDHLGDFGAMDVRFLSPKSALIVLSSKRREQQILTQHNEHFYIRHYSWFRDSPAAKHLMWHLLPGVGIGLLALGIFLPKFRYLLLPGVGIGLFGLALGIYLPKFRS